jgi:hypothetical protein
MEAAIATTPYPPNGGSPAQCRRPSTEGRGRDEDCSSPPAQIPACAANAPGSSRGSNVGGKWVEPICGPAHSRQSDRREPFAMRRCCLLLSERDRHLGRRPISQLNTWPVVSPVNASRRPSRDGAHHSGSGRLAIPYPVKDSHLLFFASFAWRTPSSVRLGRGVMSALSPFSPRLRTLLGAVGTAEKCQ